MLMFIALCLHAAALGIVIKEIADGGESTEVQEES